MFVYKTVCIYKALAPSMRSVILLHIDWWTVTRGWLYWLEIQSPAEQPTIPGGSRTNEHVQSAGMFTDPTGDSSSASDSRLELKPGCQCSLAIAVINVN